VMGLEIIGTLRKLRSNIFVDAAKEAAAEIKQQVSREFDEVINELIDETKPQEVAEYWGHNINKDLNKGVFTAENKHPLAVDNEYGSLHHAPDGTFRNVTSNYRFPQEKFKNILRRMMQISG
jgi:hypothetical protein